MQLPAEPLIYGLIFVGVLALVEGIYLVAFRQIDQPEQPGQPPPVDDAGKGWYPRTGAGAAAQGNGQQHMKSQNHPALLAAGGKAQKAAIAFTPSTADHDHGIAVAGLPLSVFPYRHQHRHCPLRIMLLRFVIGVGASSSGSTKKPKSAWPRSKNSCRTRWN